MGGQGVIVGRQGSWKLDFNNATKKTDFPSEYVHLIYKGSIFNMPLKDTLQMNPSFYHIIKLP